jgi:hypothetical protein
LPTCCNIFDAIVWGSTATCAMSSKGAHGTPASRSFCSSSLDVIPIVTLPTAALISSRAATRPGFDFRSLRIARSGSASASHNFTNRPSFAAAIISRPSLVGNASYGAIAGNAVPAGCGTVPLAM